jgi:dipeptidyl aminopeptidase/acylaminoacyl peptidase
MNITARLLLGVTLAACCLAIHAAPSAAPAAADITAIDLLTLTDIGGVNGGVSVSPDGNFVVFQTHRAVPASNTYEQHWNLLELETGRNRTLRLDAGEPMTPYGDLVGSVDDYHHAAVPSPVWSPDSKVFYFVRKAAGHIALIRAKLDGDSREVALPKGDVIELVALAQDRARVTMRVVTADAEEQAQRSLRTGLLYTGSNFNPQHGMPSFLPDTERQDYELHTDTGALSPAPAAPARLANTGIVSVAGVANPVVVLGDSVQAPQSSQIAWVGKVQTDTGEEFALFLSAADGTGVRQASTFSTEQPSSLIWSANGREIYYVAPDEDGGVGRYLRSNLFVANAGTGVWRRLTDSQGWLDSCSFAAAALTAVCTRESLSKPAEIVKVDLRRGKIAVLTDLNPHYRALAQPRFEPRSWRNRFGDQAFGILTYPKDYRAGRRYPLVVTVYHHPGFQRGSNGDEYPIPVLAAQGFFVLDFSAAPYIGHAGHLDGKPQSLDEFMLFYESPLAALQQFISEMAAQGAIDPHRVGLCGLSWGSDFAAYAISHSQLIRAAIVDTIEGDPITADLPANEAIRQHDVSQGLGGLDTISKSWVRLSSAVNAAHIPSALLINAPDWEYLWSMQTYWEMRERKLPVEMWILNHEFHEKYQPAHLLTIYQRNIDWFNFWLQDKEDLDSAKVDQYKRWRALKELQRR